jgi:hypothetical protein
MARCVLCAVPGRFGYGAGPESDALGGPLALTRTFARLGIRAVDLTSGGNRRCGAAVENAVSCFDQGCNLPTCHAYSFDMSVLVPGLRKGGRMDVCRTLAAPQDHRRRVALVPTILNQRGLNAGLGDGLLGAADLRCAGSAANTVGLAAKSKL